MEGFVVESLQALLPSTLAAPLRHVKPQTWPRVEEIRLRKEKPMWIRMDGKDQLLGENGFVQKISEAYKPSGEEMQSFLQRLSQYSVYTVDEQLRRGYMTIPGGHRVGVSGRVLWQAGRVERLAEVFSFNIRLQHEEIGMARALFPYVLEKSHFLSTLIVAPPGAGKTTLLRDLTREISYGLKIRPCRVGLVDERSELAGMVHGIASYDIGPRTDVMDGCPKDQAMIMMLRSMAPDVLVTDEIGSTDDVAALLEAGRSGVRILASVHGYSLAECMQRPALAPLFTKGQEIFARVVVLSSRLGPGTVEEVWVAGRNEWSRPMRLQGGEPQHADTSRLSRRS